MTTHQYKRCSYCGERYSYQSSGSGCHDPNNSEKWCPKCAVIAGEALLSAFEDVPRKYKRVIVDTDEATVKELVAHREAMMAKRKAEGKLWVETCSMCLFDIKDPDNHNRTFIVYYNRKCYHVSYWTKSGKESVKMEMELNIETGQLTPWRRIPQDPMALLWDGSYEEE